MENSDQKAPRSPENQGSTLVNFSRRLTVMDLFTRRIVGISIEPADLAGVAVCRMFNQAISGQPLQKHLCTDNDPQFRFYRWRENLRVLEIEEIKTVPFVPCSHPFIERMIGTIRREYLDHVVF